MPNVLISELDLSPAVVGTDIFLIQHASGAPAEHCTAAQMAVYVAASGTTYFAGTALSLATTNTFNVTTVPIANGGTNSTATATAGGAAYGTGTAFALTAAGTAGQVLTSAGASAPTWSGISGGTF